MAGEVTAVIDLCTLVAEVGLKAYDAAQKISTNFEEERKSLGERVKEMRQRVEGLREELEKDQTHNLKGIKKVLEDINREFKKIEKFFIKLDGYGDLGGLKRLLRKIKNFLSVERKFEDFNSKLEELCEKLAENIPEGILKVVLDNHRVIVDLREQQAAMIEFQQRDQERMWKLLKDNAALQENNSALQENLRLVTDRTTYLQKRAAKDFIIAPGELTDKTSLTEGSFCKYWTAMLDGQRVVVKCVRNVGDSFVDKWFARETRNLLSFSRGSIIRMYGMWDGKDEKYVVLEYMEKGTLKKLLLEERNLSLENKLTLALTAARSLSRMHTTLVHTALRTDKFLVDKDYTAKLSGMGYAMTFSSCRRFVGSDRLDDLYLYRAPEHYNPKASSKEADIYCFGIVLWEILTQTKPFSSKLGEDPTEDDVRKFLFETKGEEYDLSNLEDPAKFDLSQLVKQCRAIDPKERPNVSDIEKTLSTIYEDFSMRQYPTDELSNGGVEI